MDGKDEEGTYKFLSRRLGGSRHPAGAAHAYTWVAVTSLKWVCECVAVLDVGLYLVWTKSEIKMQNDKHFTLVIRIPYTCLTLN